MAIGIPEEALKILEELEKNKFEAYLVGGCARDFLLEKEPKDWDVATNARPEQIQKIFPDNFYENNFGTVSVLTGSWKDSLKAVEITPYRLEGKYTDKRRPDEVKFAPSLEEDLSRRDFTINAIALKISSSAKNSKDGQDYIIIDPFEGQKDLKKKIIRAVGEPEKRFEEDALRLIRAVRLAVELDFLLEKKTAQAIGRLASNLKFVSKERIKDELVKIIMSAGAERGIRLLEKLNLLKYIIPEILEGINIVGVTRHKKSHIQYDELSVFEHNLKTLGYAAKNNFNLETRLAALLHDIAKPRTKKGEGLLVSFKNHEIVGAKIAKAVLERLRFPQKTAKKVFSLVRWHFFFYNVNQVTEAGVRRLVRNVGEENISDLLLLRQADRSGSGLPKISTYRLKHLKYMIERVSRDPIEPKMLKLRGEDLMQILNLKPTPKVGWILNSLLEQVLDDPSKNDKDYLIKEAEKLNKLSDEELQKISQEAKFKKRDFEEEIDREIRRKHKVL